MFSLSASAECNVGMFLGDCLGRIFESLSIIPVSWLLSRTILGDLDLIILRPQQHQKGETEACVFSASQVIWWTSNFVWLLHSRCHYVHAAFSIHDLFGMLINLTCFWPWQNLYVDILCLDLCLSSKSTVVKLSNSTEDVAPANNQVYDNLDIHSCCFVFYSMGNLKDMTFGWVMCNFFWAG